MTSPHSLGATPNGQSAPGAHVPPEANGSTDLVLEFMRFVEDQPDQSVDVLLDKVLLKCRRLLGAEAGTIYLTEESPDGRRCVRPMCLQNDIIDLSNVDLALTVDRTSIAGYVAATGETVFVRDSYGPTPELPFEFNHAIDCLTGYRTVSVLAFPLHTFSEAVIGVVQLINRRVPGIDRPVPFEPSQTELIRPVNQLIGRAIQRTVLLDEIRAKNAELTRINQELMAALEQRERIERSLESALKAAHAANRAKDEFLANMSHELRTPLNSILGFAQLIAEQYFGPVGSQRYRDYALDIVTSGTHLKSIIDDILDLAKIEAGKATLQEEVVDVASVVDDTIRMMRPHAERAGLELRAAVAEDAGRLRADPRLLKQVLLNLLSNAVKFTPRGGRIEVAVRVDADGGCALRVSDTGIGMAQETIPTALEPFGQVASVYSRSAGGTGLGLPLVKSIAELHGGSVDVESRLGAGTAVTVHFPPERRQPA